MRKLILLLTLCKMNNCYAQWQTVTVPDNDIFYYQIHYVNENRIWCYGIDPSNHYYIIDSRDGGNTFTYDDALFLKSIHSVIPINNDTVFLCGYDASTPRQLVLMNTHSAGLAWKNIHVSDSVWTQGQIQLIKFTSEKLGLFYTASKNYDCLQFYTSDNSGETWQNVPCTGIHTSLKTGNGVQPLVIKDSTAFIKFDTSLLITHDYGHSWVSKGSLNNRDLRYFNMAFKDTLHGIAFRRIDPFSTAHYTNDGGLTWDSVSAFFDIINTLTYVPDSAGKSFFLAGGYSGSLISYDDGRSWKTFDHESHNYFGFFDSHTGMTTCPVSRGGNGVMLFTGVTNALSDLSGSAPMKIYPNPAHEFIQIESAINDLSVELYNQLGQKVLMSKSVKLDISYLNSGIYFVQLKDKHEVFIGQQKISIMH